MDEKSKKLMNAHYSRQLAQHGDSIAAISYKSEEQQIKRFQLLTDVGTISANATVLDVGCGLATLCEYLRYHGWKGHYTGIDINTELLAVNKKRICDATFLCIDILKEKYGEKHDFVFCAATLEHRPRFCKPLPYLKSMVKKLFSLSQVCFAFDIFSTNVDYMDEGKLYVNPCELLEFCYTLTPRVVLRNDCRPYELMIYLYRQIETDKFNIFTEWEGTHPSIK